MIEDTETNLYWNNINHCGNESHVESAPIVSHY